MPARDPYHDVVRAALIADGWTITDDPLWLHVGRKDLFVDLGAERLLAATKENRKIAVEVNSFPGASEVADLEMALGQYVLYRGVLEETEPERVIYLAVPVTVYEDLFTEPIGQVLFRRVNLHLIVFDPKARVIIRWIPESNPTAGSSSK